MGSKAIGGKGLGDQGEALVAAWLRKKGYQILAGQYRCRFGEIDLIARKKAVICFVEVKTRTNLSVALPREYVGRQKQERLRTTAQCYLSEQELDCLVRFDVAEVYMTEGKPPRIEYIENAFS